MTTWDKGVIAFILALLLALGIQSCAPRLHPLLVENHGGKELSDAEVDIRIERNGPLATQAGCLADDPLAFWKLPVLGCAKLGCADNKMWTTDKICTCLVRLGTDSALEHELKHCRGWVGG